MLPARKHNYQAWLVPYAEGTLDAARAARLEAQLARDPVLSEEARRVRAVAASLRRAAALSTSKADPRLALDPAPLWPGVQERLTARPRRPQRLLPWAGGACAASLALAALLLHGTVSGVGRVQTPPAAPVRTANAGSAPLSGPQTDARLRHKKAGHRLHARPAHLAFIPAKLLMPMRPASRFPVQAQVPVPALPASAPVDTAPSAHTAVALGDGSAHFRLASPVHDALPITHARPSAALPEERTSENDSAQTAPMPPGAAAQTQAIPASAPDDAASSSAASPMPAPHPARKKHRHRGHRRHHSRPRAAPASDIAPAVPASATPSPRNPRVL